ncbi:MULTISPECIES: flavin reductase family protein [Natrialba]|uniref:Flavin reductase family protein n=1 Tax=Natrialba swarupiae TaxID=2448032 RepID=A0A5D5AML9_9EURY|nr:MULTISPECIES: flavin reductase family protein [Natrialba]MWV41011.1 flavin reductase [Natrialba sp. INN-245]TYT60962.1 flavin reductase family protein [Natrialba swarupiae]
MVSGDDFRTTLGTFATGVTVVTFTLDGDDHALTVNSFTSLSLDPPLVLWNCDVDASSHDLLEKADNYAVNILTEDQEELSTRFAGQHHEMDDPFEGIDLFRSETGAPIFEDTLAYLDCTIDARHEGGDHTIFVGRVEDAAVQNPDEQPLIFFRGNYEELAE